MEEGPQLISEAMSREKLSERGRDEKPHILWAWQGDTCIISSWMEGYTGSETHAHTSSMGVTLNRERDHGKENRPSVIRVVV